MTLIDNLVIPQGAAWNRTYTITHPATGDPLDLAGWTAHAQIRRNAYAPVLFEWHTTPTGDQGAITLATGTATVALTGVTDSATWVFIHAEWDLFLFNPAGQPTRVVKGTTSLEPAITR